MFLNIYPPEYIIFYIRTNFIRTTRLKLVKKNRTNSKRFEFGKNIFTSNENVKITMIYIFFEKLLTKE